MGVGRFPRNIQSLTWRNTDASFLHVFSSWHLLSSRGALRRLWLGFWNLVLEWLGQRPFHLNGDGVKSLQLGILDSSLKGHINVCSKSSLMSLIAYKWVQETDAQQTKLQEDISQSIFTCLTQLCCNAQKCLMVVPGILLHASTSQLPWLLERPYSKFSFTETQWLPLHWTGCTGASPGSHREVSFWLTLQIRLPNPKWLINPLSKLLGTSGYTNLNRP